MIPGPHGAQDLLLDAADGQHAAGEGDLAGHGDVVPRRAAGEGRDHGGRHRHARRRAILGDGARRDVDVQVALEALGRDAQGLGVRPGVGPGRAGGLLHHVAELAGEHQLALALHGRGLDEHDVAAGRGVVHAGRDADLVVPGRPLGVDLGPAEDLAHLGRRPTSTRSASRAAIFRATLRESLPSSRSSCRTPDSRV